MGLDTCMNWGLVDLGFLSQEDLLVVSTKTSRDSSGGCEGSLTLAPASGQGSMEEETARAGVTWCSKQLQHHATRLCLALYDVPVGEEIERTQKDL